MGVEEENNEGTECKLRKCFNDAWLDGHTCNYDEMLEFSTFFLRHSHIF